MHPVSGRLMLLNSFEIWKIKILKILYRCLKVLTLLVKQCDCTSDVS